MIKYFLIVHHLLFIFGMYYITATFGFIYCIVPLFFSYLGLYVIAHKGYHMNFSHKEYKDTISNKILSIICVIFTGWATSPLGYALAHRLHHKYSDTEKDPHSPKYLNFYNLALGNWKKMRPEPALIKDFVASSFQKNLYKNRIYYHLMFVIIFLIITPFIISPIVVHFFWATNLVNYLSHYNGVLRNCPELFPIYPWGWKHKDHHLMYENGILQRIT